MSIQFSESFKSIESWALDQIPLNSTPRQAQSEWSKWNVIQIVSYIFSPFLITLPLTIPLICHANRKMAEAKAVESTALGLDAYRRKDWKMAVEHFEHLNDSRLKNVYQSTVEYKFRNNPILLNEELNEYNERQLVSKITECGNKIRTEVNATIPHDPHGGTNLFVPTDAAISAIPLVCHNGDDNKTIVFGTLLGCAYLHQAADELEKQRAADKLKVKACTVISTQYLGRTRGKLNLVGADFLTIRNKLRFG